MNRNKIKLIIFDAYGAVLSRGYPDTIAILSKRFKISKKRLFDIIYKKYFNMAARRKITQKQAWQKPVKELGLPIIWQELRDLHMKLFRINYPVLKIVRQLRKKYIIVMLSKNTRSQLADTKKKFPEVWKSFDAIINTWELGLPKASKKTILTLAKKFKVRPSEILYIDNQKNNLIEPKRLGVKTIFYQNFSQFKKELNKYL